MKQFKFLILLLLLNSLTFVQEAKAQIDTVFWFAAPWVTPDHDNNVQMAFRISSFDSPTMVRVQQPSNTYDVTFVVPPNSVYSLSLESIVNELESKPADMVLQSGFKITSDTLITVIYDFISDTVTISPGTPNNPETYSLKGQNGMGIEFVVPFQTLWNNRVLAADNNGDGVVTQPKQFFSVVATEDNTTIWITPRCAVMGGHPANVTYSVFLPQAGNVYTCENLVMNTNVPGNNLSGSIVVSDKPVAVTTNDDSVNPAGGGGCYDLMGDQIVPTDVVGTEYIVNRGFLNAGSNESIFVVATENFTTLTVDDGTVSTYLMNQGDTRQYSITQALTYVTSDKPVYLIHMSGYGCELGQAILPPLNCSGSDQVAFARNNGQQFLLNILCRNGVQGDFELNGNPALVPAGAFAPVPGTGGEWVGAQIAYTTAQVPVNTANLITNSSDLFSLGVINGGPASGCLYHYMSSFIRRVYTDAGNDTILCNGEPFIDLNGSVKGGATTGIWTVLDGAGAISTPTDLITTYTPTVSDYAQGYLTFVLSSTGNCDPVRDTLKITFIQSPIVTTSPDDIYCKNNITEIPISGTLEFAAGINWTGGIGGSFANSGSLTTTYTPSPTDLANDSVAIFLTSAGSFFSCPDDQDTLVIYFTNPPIVIAGPDLVICSNSDLIDLTGSVTGPTTTGIWSTTGTGAFDSSELDLNADYLVSAADTANGFLTIYLTSTANGNCLAVVDSFEVTIIDKPEIEITSTDSICSNLNNLNLTGLVSYGTSTWTTNGVGTIISPTSVNTIYNISPIDTANGFIDVFLSSTGGICPSEQDSIRIFFIDPPQVFAGLDQEFCSNEVIALNGNVTGPSPSGSWSSTGTGVFSPSNNLLATTYIPSALDVANGSVNLILTPVSAFGCVPDDDMLVVTFKEIPNADFNFNIACLGTNTVFEDNSSISLGAINTWEWDFGDMSNSISQNPNHTYGASGNFNVTLVANSNNGCSDTITKVVLVNPAPIVDFNMTNACVGELVQFTDISFISPGSIVSWHYEFGDGVGTSTNQNPTYTYTGVGTFSAILTATSDQGCIGTLAKEVNVLVGPQADFSINPNPAFALETVNFTDLSVGNGINQWIWDFGNGNGNNVQNPSHNYADGGVYIVYLEVTDEDGCTDTITKNVVIALMPALPTAFTPNGDNENDVFIIRGGPFNAVDFKIYNHWGELVFSSIDQNEGWDGTFKGENSPLGVYSWTYTVILVDGREVKKSGDVTLIR